MTFNSKRIPLLSLGLAGIGIMLSILWHGSFFPIQYIGIAIALLTWICFIKSISVHLNVYLLLGITVVMLISLLFFSANHYIGVLEWITYTLLPLSLLFFANCKYPEKIENSIYLACIIVSILGLLSYAGILQIPYAILENGKRLQSVLQYANTTALLMIVGFFYSIKYWTDSKNVCHLACAVLLIISLVLTGSRIGFAVLVLLSIVFVMTKIASTHKIIAIIAIFFLLAIIAMTNLRIAQISLFAPTIIERLITFQDACRILRNSELFGLGIGNWQEQQFLYQTAPYFARYIHNYYLQLCLDGGVLPLFLFLFVAISALITGWKEKNIHFFILLAILLHISLDFDMSFGGVILITTFSISQLQGKSLFENRLNRAKYFFWIPILFFVSVWCSEWHYSQSNMYLQTNQVEESMVSCEKSRLLNPFNNAIYYNMAQSTRNIDSSEMFLRKALNENPFDTQSMEMLVRIYVHRGQYIEAINLTEELLEKWRFNEQYQGMYRVTLAQAVEYQAISNDEMEIKLSQLNERIESINPLYAKYIAID